MRLLSLLRFPVVAALCAAPLPAFCQFTVMQAVSAPFSNQLTAAPAKARVAWFTDAEGRRNVWVAGSHEAARPITHNTEDDGQDIDNITWSRDAERLAWTRGTGAEGSEHTLAANPAELPNLPGEAAPVRQHVEWVDLQGGGVHVVEDGHTPTFLADGQHLLFLRHGNIWIANLAAEKDNAQQLLYVRGTSSSLRLSPDGTQLAFVSERGDHSFVGVYTFATKTLTWLDPGTGLDHDPVWSPDGKRIAFIREVPIVSPIADRWMREGQPWSIRVADVATGNGRELWHADKGAGSLFHGVSAHAQLIWMKDGSIVFPWEKNGWTGLYKVNADHAGAPEAIAAGAFEVDAVASDGSRIVWSDNRHEAGRPADEDRATFSATVVTVRG